MAIDHGLAYILSRQDEDGAWTDWSLPPGPSRHWTTAHVGRCLTQLPGPPPAQLSAALSRAADWLLSHRLQHGAWGYNGRVDPDADTTALAVMFLAAMGRDPGPGPLAFLRQAQQPDGGFATFLPDGLTGAWGKSHVEITAAALLALRAVPEGIDAAHASAGLAWLRHARRNDGMWPAFWWTTPYLATQLALSCLAAFGEGKTASPDVVRRCPDDSLQAAHVLAMTARASPQHPALTQQLITAQKADGSWAGRAALRIPPRDCAEAWAEPLRGPVFADEKSLFTTACVVSALAPHRTDALTRPDGTQAIHALTIKTDS
ncbi:prenyltransferase/squalene oxidase repeat-containing protein [Antarctobacter jejuensis]|uniref:prenyltransferase/squalene oxidase repeat-containing protein n=1 Tax=Antarctobacter jejuensis TaxID=1439938 RepID=UPI003FD4D6EC